MIPLDIFEHPGNLGPTRGSLSTIHHADWPAYPEGDDFWTPFLQLTAFTLACEIDGCLMNFCQKVIPADYKKPMHVRVRELLTLLCGSNW